MYDTDAYSIDQFCSRHGISRSALYNAWRDGIGPRRMQLGDRILISREAAQEWRRQREQAAETAPPPRPRGRQAREQTAAAPEHAGA